jgi:hypothetical protein
MMVYNQVYIRNRAEWNLQSSWWLAARRCHAYIRENRTGAQRLLYAMVFHCFIQSSNVVDPEKGTYWYL